VNARAPASPVADSVDLADIQGIVRFGYKRHTQAAFVLLRVRDRDAARAWLASVPVSSAATLEPPPDTAMQLALSSPGLSALGVADEIVQAFSSAAWATMRAARAASATWARMRRCTGSGAAASVCRMGS
jgi:hypothetical protein